MKQKKFLSSIIILILCLALLPLQALAATANAEILAINTEIYDAASTGDNAIRFYSQASARVESDDPAIIALANEITGGYSEPLRKAREVHDWVCRNIWYDLDAENTRIESPDQSAVLTLERGYAVCQGYANLTTALLRAAGIPAKNAYGRGAESVRFTASDVTADPNHEWTEALLDGRWVIIDTTWDSDNLWENGKKTRSMGMYNRDYFDISLSDFSLDHRIDGYTPFMGAIISDDGTLKKYGGPGDDLPDGITSIGPYAFSKCENLTYLIIPDSVTSLESSAFSNCDCVKEISLPATLKSIPANTFLRCTALEKIHIPNGVTMIGSAAFSGCEALSDTYIPPTVVTIGERAFYGCPLLSQVIIPSSVTMIGDRAFGSVYDRETGTAQKVDGFTIIGTAGSAAEVYASKNSLKFYILTALPTSAKVLVNGEAALFDAYNIMGSNYFKLRDLAFVLNGTEKQFEIGWDASRSAIDLTANTPYTPVGGEMSISGVSAGLPIATTADIYLDGRIISLSAYNIGGYNYFKLRDIGLVLNFGVEWDEALKTIAIDTSKAYTE